MLTPLDPQRWGRPEAAHLLNRAGFGGAPATIDGLAALGLKGAVDRLLNAPDDSAQYPKPEWAEPLSFAMFVLQNNVDLADQEQRKMKFKEYQQSTRRHMIDLTGWWLQRMAGTPNPFREKLTLFWHGHFATGITKVRDAYKMWRQNQTLRDNALGNFGTMVKAISRDPAMLVWLDGAESLRSKPNENWARELLELFTLGIGNYSEDDIQNAARAFTGYKINPADLSFYPSALQHDTTEKTFLGKTGNLDGDAIVDIVLAQPACAQFIGRKLWRYFVEDAPSPATVNQVAERFRANRYEIKPLLREVFLSADFYAPAVMRSQVKSPIQWLVSNTKILETKLPPTPAAANALRQLGQVPFDPPNVKGWDGGKAWITTSTLLTRYNLSNYVLGTGTMSYQRTGNQAKKTRPQLEVRNRTGGVDLAVVAPPAARKDAKTLVDTLTQRLFQGGLPAPQTQKFLNFLEPHPGNFNDTTVGELLHLMMSTPEYQLT